MTPAQAATYHRQYLRWHTQQERIAVRIIVAGLTKIANSLISILPSTHVDALSGTLPLLLQDAEFTAMLESIYITVGLDAAANEYSRLLPMKSSAVPVLVKDRDVPGLPPLKPKPDPLIRVARFSSQWRAKMIELARNSETASRITKMAEGTRDLIREAIAQANTGSLNIRDLARSIRDVVVDKSRAMLIARTETTRAANAGHEAGAMSTNLALLKRWICTYDGRTRESHIEASKLSPVARDSVFIVSGLPMKYPGDPAGGAAECANCRCVVSYVPTLNVLNLN